MGRLLAEWGEAPAGCLFLLPLWNPVLIAEQVGTLAAIARGRFIFQCGLGDDEAQFAAMGADISYRPSAFEESFDLVQRLLRGRDGERVGPLPLRERARWRCGPPSRWSTGSAPARDPAIDRAARIADGWLASPALTLDEARARPTSTASAAPSPRPARPRPSPSGATSSWATSRRRRRRRWPGPDREPRAIAASRPPRWSGARWSR